MACLDTSALVALIRKDPAATLCFCPQPLDRGRVVSTTVVSLCELYSGAYASREPQKELSRVRDLISNLRLLELDEGAAWRYGDLANDAALKREPIGDFDLII